MPIKKKYAFYQGIPFLNLTKNDTNYYPFYGLSQSNYPIFLRIRTIKNSCFLCEFVCPFFFCESSLFLSRMPVLCECSLLGLSCGKVWGMGYGVKTVLDNVVSSVKHIDMFCFISLRKKHSNWLFGYFPSRVELLILDLVSRIYKSCSFRTFFAKYGK